MKAAAIREGAVSQQVVDDFWHSKHEIYTLVIRSRLGVLYDSVFQEIARRNADVLTAADFFASESEIFRKIPMLRDVLKKDKLRQIATSVLPDEVAYQVRQFFVDPDVSFSAHTDRKRYRQAKSPTFLTLGDILPA
jgi:hypothetical protein